MTIMTTSAVVIMPAVHASDGIVRVSAKGAKAVKASMASASVPAMGCALDASDIRVIATA